MKLTSAITINFSGGIISPGSLLKILGLCKTFHIFDVRFGLRQQAIIEVMKDDAGKICRELTSLGIDFDCESQNHPNIVSSYPAEEIFITNTWLSEGTYKDILDLFQYRPRYKINISDTNQSFTPVLTGNINWVAAKDDPHFWQLLIRFPKTNYVSEWEQMVYTNDVAKVSRCIEEYFDADISTNTNYEEFAKTIFAALLRLKIILKPARNKANLPDFNLPYYEGLNRYGDKYWLGIYRRDEIFDVDFLIGVCRLCLATKTGQLCATPWKSIIIKNISAFDRESWNKLLNTFKINVRHAANELNFQVEDFGTKGLRIKQFLINDLQKDDIRSFGICFGIKTKQKSEIFCNILIRRKCLFSIAGFDFFPLYDILCSKDFNPNERTEFVFSSNNPRFVLAEQLRRAVNAYYVFKARGSSKKTLIREPKQTHSSEIISTKVFQCTNCLTIFEPPKNVNGPLEKLPDDPEKLPADFACELCESPASSFVEVDKPAELLV